MQTTPWHLLTRRVPLAIAAVGGMFMALGWGYFIFGTFLFIAAALVQDRNPN